MGAYLNVAKTPFNPLDTDGPVNMTQLTPMMARLVVESGLYCPAIVILEMYLILKKLFFLFRWAETKYRRL